MKKLLILAVVLSALLSLWQVSLVSGTEPIVRADLEKTGPEVAAPGETITYHFWVHNCGNLPLLSGAQVYDPLLNQSDDGLLWSGNLYPDNDPRGPSEVEFTWEYTLPVDYCGEFTNDAWAEGHVLYGGVEYHAYDEASWTVNIVCAPGTGTPGYWMNHPEAWPMDSITIGGETYSKDDAIDYMKMEVKGDKTFTMFPALVAAKLNVAIGNDDSCIPGTIEAADAWMAAHPIGSGVKGGGEDSPWRDGEPLYKELDKYNNGELDCVSSRDDLE